MKRPALIPILSVADLRLTLEWFRQLGFATVYNFPGPNNPDHAHVHRFDWHVKLSQGPGRNVGLTLACDVGEHDLDEYRQCLRTHGLRPTPVQDEFWGERSFSVESPDGFRLMFCKTVRELALT